MGKESLKKLTRDYMKMLLTIIFAHSFAKKYQLPAGCVQLWLGMKGSVFCMLVEEISHLGVKAQTVSALISFPFCLNEYL